MRNLLRCLVLAVVLVPALGMPAAKALSDPDVREACINGGNCSVSNDPCIIKADCPRHETCLCP